MATVASESAYSPPAISTPAGPRIVSRSSDDLAATGHQLGFSLQIMGLWLVGSLSAALLAALADSALVFAVIVGGWSAMLAQFFLGGIARIVGAHLQGEALVGARAAWSFLARRWVGVLVGASVATLGVSAVVGMFLLIVMGLTRSAGDLGSSSVL